MPTVCVRFRFRENWKVTALMDACASIQRKAVDVALENNKTAMFTIIRALYPFLKGQYSHLYVKLPVPLAQRGGPATGNAHE